MHIVLNAQRKRQTLIAPSRSNKPKNAALTFWKLLCEIAIDAEELALKPKTFFACLCLGDDRQSVFACV